MTFSYLIAPRQMQALDIGRHCALIETQGVQAAPSSLWSNENPRGRVERYLSGSTLARVVGLMPPRQHMIHDTESGYLEELRERCRNWVEHFGAKEVLLMLEVDGQHASLPWFNALPNGSTHLVSTSSPWTLRSIFVKMDQDLLLDYENGNQVRGHTRRLDFEFRPGASAQLSFPF